MKCDVLGVQQEKDYFARLVAECIGKVNPILIKKIINTSNKERYLFHGVKNDALFPLVNKEGVKSLTPEGGNVSFWTSGARLFGVMLKDKLSTYDTTFFHYADSYTPNPNYSLNTIVVTNYSELEKLGIKGDEFKEDGYLKIKDTVPRSAIHILRAELKHKNKNLLPREYSKAVERISLIQLHAVLTGCYESGTITFNESSL